MAKQQNDHLFQLVKSLSKAEKRQFKLYATRLESSSDAKFVRLFDMIEKQQAYDEAMILKKNPDLQKVQLPNLKAHLYKQILVSLRLSQKNIDKEIGIREQLDYAKVLYNKGLYLQSLKILGKAKELATKSELITLTRDIVEFEKTIESQYITQGVASRIEQLIEESETVNQINLKASTFSNLTLQLYTIFLRQGYVRTPSGKKFLKERYDAIFPEYEEENLSFYERILLYQAKLWYYNITQNFPYAYKYSQKLVKSFHRRLEMIMSFPELYLKGLSNYLSILFYAGYFSKLEKNYAMLRIFDRYTWSDNIHMLIFQTRSEHLLNLCILKGDYQAGVEAVPDILSGLKEYERFIDSHHQLIFYYKIGCMYFGNQDYRKSIHYLNLIINEKNTMLRGDLHTFARLLQVIAYYELEDHDYVEHLLKSTYRFLLQKKESYKILKTVMRFIRRTPSIPPENIKAEFASYLDVLKELQKDPYEQRAFLYLDIISWLESKIEDIPISEVVRRKLVDKR